MPDVNPIGVDPLPVAEVVDVPKLDTDTADKLAAMGVTIGAVKGKGQEMTLPTGWVLSDVALIDEAGAERAVLTPLSWDKPDKALSLRPRYSVRFIAEGEGTTAHMAVVDSVDGSEVVAGGSYARFDPTIRIVEQAAEIAFEAASSADCATYLANKLPQWRDPAAYWPAPKS